MTYEEPLARARQSLEGLSVGDAVGAFFEGSKPGNILKRLEHLPGSPWRYTDDTNMALSVYRVLRKYHAIEQDKLTADFAERATPRRGYGLGTMKVLRDIKGGVDWRTISPHIFDGGSYGNGGPMRVAPIGAYYADELDRLRDAAVAATEVTHYHPEAKAGAIAVALAAAAAVRFRRKKQAPTRQAFINSFIEHIPPSDVRQGVEKAMALDGTVFEAAEILGRGWNVSSQDTVPFVLWCAGEYLSDYETAIKQTISVGGDADTTAAMVGGIVVLFDNAIPAEWKAKREDLPDWAFED